MNDIYAVVDKGVVVNLVVWDGESEWAPEAGKAVLCGIDVGIGWLYDGERFTAPIIEKTPEELSMENMSTARSEYERATVSITALNEQIEDADYSGTTEDTVKTELTAWTEYRKKLRAYIKSGDGSHALPERPISK
ncbi:hypothetical protein [Serratia proteamaculans]